MSFGWTVISHAFNLSITEAGTGEFLSLRPTWCKERVLGWPRLYREKFSLKKRHKSIKVFLDMNIYKCDRAFII